MFIVAVSLSAVAAFYSIVGLAAIFAAAVWPIVIMGTILEVAKLTVTVWLHEYWRECRWIMKVYLIPAVLVLMVITSMGIFGFLSKAHIDQVIPTGDKSAQLALFDERIANERAIVENSRSLIKQMDDTVNGIIEKGESREIKLRDGRTIVRSPAEQALQVRRSQAQDRDRLTKTIEESQARVAAIQQERAPVAKEIRGLEAEVGPIKYIAALIYGDEPNTNLLERAVRWMIIILVAVFDPLAIMMLLAATESLKWHRESQRKDPDHDPVIPPEPPAPSTPDPDPPRDPEPELSAVESHVPPVVATRPAYLDRGGNFGFQNLTPMVAPEINPSNMAESDAIVNTENSESESEKNNEGKEESIDLGNGYIQYQGKVYSRASFIESFPELNNDHPKASFGLKFPAGPAKGDMFVRTDYMPTRVFKFNGTGWIEVDKNLNSSVTHNDGYIDHLIEKISKGEYDLELLSDKEQEQIEKKLKNDK